MELLLRHHPLEEEGEERQVGAAYADGVRWHLALKQSGWRVPVDVAINVQQGMALAVVLPQERCRHRSAGVHRAPNQRGPRFVEEVGCPGEGQEEDLGPHRRHPDLEGERPEGVRHHRGLPRKEGGTIDDARAGAVRDGARGIIRRNDARQGGAPQL